MDKDIAKEFRGVLLAHIDKLATTDDLVFVKFDPYSVGDKPRMQTEAVRKVPVLSDLLKQMEKPAQVEYATPDDSFFNSVWAYAVVLHIPNLQVAYFRKFQPSKVIRGGGLKALLHEGTFTRIGDPVFNFDEQADAIVVEDEVVILQETLFEQMFELVGTIYAPLAKEAIQEIATLNLIDNVKGFEAACQNDERKQKKLADIHQNVRLDQITFDKLYQVADNWEVDVELDRSSRRIIFNESKTWGILKLINDDHLRSPITRERYEVQSKRKVQRRPRATRARQAPAATPS